MEKIKVNKQELLGIVKQNREKHKKEYLESIKAYRVKVADLFTKELEKVLSGEKFNVYFDLTKPESHEKDYDLAIRMLEMSVDENVEIERDEFNQLVNDEWSWKRNFKASYYSNSSYFGLTSISSGTSGCCGTNGLEGSSGISGTTYNVLFSEDEI